ncbi:MAG: hypothetical protein JO342_17145 [Solirubrobacterales bacterium]|nr:hypothetical protein [Solirubrobacterales bacterium]
MREDFTWARAEPRPGRFNWTSFDHAVRSATTAGLVVLPVLYGSPGWAAPAPSDLPVHSSAYAAFVAATVRRYATGGAFWRANPKLPVRAVGWYQLWNDHPVHPAAYARLAAAAVIAARQANPTAHFVIEGGTYYLPGSRTEADWIESMYAEVPHLGKYFDALAVQPTAGGEARYTSRPPDPLEQIHLQLVAHGDGHKPLWVTDIGRQSCRAFGRCGTEAQEAASVASYLKSLETNKRSLLAAVFVQNLHDLAPNQYRYSALVGLNGDWGIFSASDMEGVFPTDRLDASTARGTEYPSTYNRDGIDVIVTMPGVCPTCGYSKTGVSAIDPIAWSSQAVSWYRTYCASSSINCPAIEVLNEPDGSWFWGAHAVRQANANAYAKLLQDVYTAFHDVYGSDAPKILGAYDSARWGLEVWSNTAGIPVNSYVDGVVVHPYGGDANCGPGGAGVPGDASSEGNRGQVIAAHEQTGKPVWVTEVGWSTALRRGCAGDSEQWTYRQQARSIYSFVMWARATGYVAAITYYAYRNGADTGQQQFGVETWGGTKKPGWTALQEAANDQPCTVC